MRRFTGTEFGILVVAAISIFVGADLVVHPTEMNVLHQAYRRFRLSIEHVSKEGSQIYGVLAIVLGLGLIWMVFYGRRK
jgi:hypothetical protein